MEEKTKKLIRSVSLISGTIIGVGFLSLPYITSKVGIFTMAFYFLFLGGIAIFLHLLFAEVSLKTPDFKRFPQFAGIYLGKNGQNIAYLTTIFGLFGALLSYLIVGGRFIEAIFPGLGEIASVFVFFLPGAILIFKGIKSILKVEFWGLAIFFLVLVFLFFLSFSHFKTLNFKVGDLDKDNFFLPYGPILFSLWGAALIPEAEEVLGKEKRNLLKVVPLAVLIPIFVYLFFIFWILGISGTRTTESALEGLKNLLPGPWLELGLFLGILSCFTSFVPLGLTLKKVFFYDLKIEKTLSSFLAIFLPLIFYLVGLRNFILVISAIGAIFLAIDGILIVLMHSKIYPKKFGSLKSFLILVLMLGIIYEIIHLKQLK